MHEPRRSAVLVLASTYPRWRNDPEPGFVHELCRRLADRADVIALVPDAPGADKNGFLDNVEIVRYRYAPRSWQTLVNNGGIAANIRNHPWKLLLVPGFVLGQYLAVCRILKYRKIDLIHAHWLVPQGLIALWLKKKFGVPYIVTSHGGDLFGLRGKILEKLKRHVARSSSAMTVVSTAMYEEARRIGLFPPALDVIPMGVDLRERFVIDSNVQRADNEIIFVGRLVEKKGLVYLLRSMPEVLVGRPDVTLTIVGFGPEEGALRRQAHELGIESKVKFLGAMPQKELPALYQRASIFVAPFVRDATGDQEGLPVVLMEAIGCGCPVVVGRVAGIRDLLGDAAEEICIDPQDLTALSGMILEALNAPERALVRAGEIRAAVFDRIDWKVIANRYFGLIETHAHGSELHN